MILPKLRWSKNPIIIINDMYYKKCNKCNEMVPLNEYYKNKSNPHGFSYTCKNCTNKVITEKKKEKARIEGRKFRIKSPLTKKEIEIIIYAKRGGSKITTVLRSINNKRSKNVPSIPPIGKTMIYRIWNLNDLRNIPDKRKKITDRIGMGQYLSLWKHNYKNYRYNFGYWLKSLMRPACPVCGHNDVQQKQMSKSISWQCIKCSHFFKMTQFERYTFNCGIWKECLFCGKSTLLGKKNMFCSKKCAIQHRTTIVGSEHPLYTGGKRDVFPYSKFFYNIRKEILIRDKYVCSWCRKALCVLPYDHAVHHITHVKEINLVDWLISLCHSCHSTESMIVFSLSNENKIEWIEECIIPYISGEAIDFMKERVKTLKTPATLLY